MHRLRVVRVTWLWSRSRRGVTPRLQPGGPPGGATPPDVGAAPLCNTGAVGSTGQSEREWKVNLDKLSVCWTTVRGPDVLDAFGVEARVGPGKRRGRWATAVRWGRAVGWGGEPVFVKHTAVDGLVTAELRVEFNPALQGVGGCAALGEFLRAAEVDVGGGVVERADVACDLLGVDRSTFRLDGGRHHMTRWGEPDQSGFSEGVGYGGAWDAQALLYDKRAERVAKGLDDPGPWMRFEVRGRGRWLSSVGAGPGERVRVRDLGSLVWPGKPEWCVREFVTQPESFADDRYWLLAAAAYGCGTRFSERAAREVLGRNTSYRDRLRCVAWPAVEPCPRAAFERVWPAVCARYVGALCGEVARA